MFTCTTEAPCFHSPRLQPLVTINGVFMKNKTKNQNQNKGLQWALTCKEMHTLGKTEKVNIKKPRVVFRSPGGIAEVRESQNSLLVD